MYMTQRGILMTQDDAAGRLEDEGNGVKTSHNNGKQDNPAAKLLNTFGEGLANLGGDSARSNSSQEVENKVMSVANALQDGNKVTPSNAIKSSE